ncbi:hypothetical protein EWM64_g10566 [Hericium alpestre]|uniref:Uncharacterized protein n=1 Tax=Hericium alpestre TaxID=135208 RepID=A0A4Y9ZI79_9AGAM|nr:hypothetical protein EWM64_g10566 [Hericium alpestre]
MNGPPTPPSEDQPLPVDPAPPTAEETSAAAPAAQPENPPILPEQSPYFQIFPKLGSLAAKGEYEELVQAAERADLNGLHDDHPTRLLVTAPLVLSYLILDDL